MRYCGQTADSDNGTDPNSDNGSGTSDDPTPLAIPDLSTAKSVLGSPVANIMDRAYSAGPELLEPELKENFQEPPTTLAVTNGHHQDWIDAARGGPAASSNFAVGAHLTEISLLGVVALRLGKKIHWDHESMSVTNSDEADRFIKGTYRSGWELQ